MMLFLKLLSGLAWTIVYLDSIRIGLRDKTYAMPVAALGLNFAWESINTVHDFSTDIDVQAYINLAWMLADVVIVYTYFRFGRREFPALVSGPMFVGWSVLVFGASFVVQGLFVAEFGWSGGATYSAFLQNLLMSGLFIAMFVSRGGARGQSVLIGVAKFVGTLAPTILFGVLDRSAFVLGIGLLCAVFDLVYIGLLVTARRREAASAA